MKAEKKIILSNYHDLVDEKELDLFAAYHRNITEKVAGLGLAGHLQVSSHIEQRDAAFFKDKLTLAFTGFNSDQVAILAGTEAGYSPDMSKKPIVPLWVIPRIGTSSLYQRPQTGEIYTDRFYVCEGGVLKPIKPTRPVAIDGLNQMFDGDREFPYSSSILSPHKELADFTDDKWRARQFFTEHGVRMPAATLVPRDNLGVFEQRLAAFRAERDEVFGIVIKGRRGSGGNFVKMFDPGDTDGARKFAEELGDCEMDVLIEERIRPKHYDPADDLKNIDYNFRVLSTLNKKPFVIDWEVRLSSLSDKPVNVSQGSSAARATGLFSNYNMMELMSRSAADSALLGEYTRQNLGETLDLVGNDYILAQDNHYYLIEANAGHVGGLCTLTRLDQAPLASIGEQYIPSTEEFLDRNHQNRSLYDRASLVQLGYSPGDEYELIKVLNRSKAFPIVLEIANKGLDDKPEDQYLQKIKGITLWAMKDYQGALPFIKSASDREGIDSNKTPVLMEIYRKLGMYEELAALVKQYDEIGDHKDPHAEIEKATFLLTVNPGDANLAFHDLRASYVQHFKDANILTTAFLLCMIKQQIHWEVNPFSFGALTHAPFYPMRKITNRAGKWVKKLSEPTAETMQLKHLISRGVLSHQVANAERDEELVQSTEYMKILMQAQTKGIKPPFSEQEILELMAGSDF